MALTAEAENLLALTVKATLSSPLPKIFKPSNSFLTKPAAFKASKSTTALASNLFKSSTLTIANSFLLTFVKPRFGKRMNNGVCPPSKPGFLPPPDLAP